MKLFARRARSAGVLLYPSTDSLSKQAGTSGASTNASSQQKLSRFNPFFLLPVQQ